MLNRDTKLYFINSILELVRWDETIAVVRLVDRDIGVTSQEYVPIREMDKWII